MAVVKANAYGHGLIPTALALAEADAFAVARLEEGSSCARPASPSRSCCSRASSRAEQLLEAARHGFDLVVHDPLQIELLEEFTRPSRFLLWIKIDTGMNRLGFRPEDFPAALERLRGCRPAPLEIRLLTHLARADERDDDDDPRAARALQRAPLGGSDYATSIANSAGLFGSRCRTADWVRPGLALYGASPFADESRPRSWVCAR